MAGPSTRNLAGFPAPTRLRELTQSLALLDEILCEDLESRYYSFYPAWNESSQMASMRNGEGDHWFLWYGEAGLVLLGLDHEAPRIAAIDNFPEGLRYALEEPAFDGANISFVIWRRASDDQYLTFENPNDRDGSAELLAILDDQPKTYADWASEYYDCKVDLAAVEKIYAHEPLDAEMVKLLRRDVDFDVIAKSARAMGYPVADVVASP